MGLIIYLIALCVLYSIVTTAISFRSNLKKAKASGIAYVIVPVFFFERWWLVGHALLFPLFAKLPSSWTKWVDFCIPDSAYQYRSEIFQRVGHDTFLTVAPGGIVLYTCEPNAIAQITTRRNDFPKPTAIYQSVDVYGKNLVSTEGSTWRRHRKATSPPFTEKNNHLVWSETIDQTQKMVRDWAGEDGKGSKVVDRVMDDTMRLSLHVISRAGFGRRMEWPDADAKQNDDQGYIDPSKIKNDKEGLEEGHSMTYTYAIRALLDSILVQFLIPRWMMKLLPSKRLRKANEAYNEWGNYMKEAVERKKTELESDHVVDGKNSWDLMGQLVKEQMRDIGTKGGDPLSDTEVLGNMFVFILAGHETAANTIHFSLLYLAMNPASQRALQKDLDGIFQGRLPSEWNYDEDLPQLFGGMAGAVMNEELRLLPPVVGIPKSTWGVSDQQLTVEGKSCTVPGGITVTLCTSSAHRNPKYWPTGKPKLPGGKPCHPVSNIDNDLEEFRPERWLVSESGETENTTKANGHTKEVMPTETVAGGDLGINEASDTSEKLYKPVKGAYLPFSDGYRSCIGRRFAQVEILATLAIIFQNYSMELAVDDYASDEELNEMDVEELVEVWQKAAEDARELLLNGMGTIITLQMRKGHVKLRMVPRGKERYPDNVDEMWKKRHPERCSTKGVPGWKPWQSPRYHGIK